MLLVVVAVEVTFEHHGTTNIRGPSAAGEAYCVTRAVRSGAIGIGSQIWRLIGSQLQL